MVVIDKDVYLFNLITNYVETTLYVKYSNLIGNTNFAYTESGYKIYNYYNDNDCYENTPRLYNELTRVFGIDPKSDVGCQLFTFCNDWYKHKISNVDILASIMIDKYINNITIELGARDWYVLYDGKRFENTNKFINHVITADNNGFIANSKLYRMLEDKIYDLIINESTKIMGS